MRLMRRTFIKSAAAGVATLATGRIGLASPTLPPEGGIPARRLYDVTCENFFDWRAYFDERERKLAERCLELAGDTWYQDIEGSLTYSLFTFSHRIKNGKVNSARSGFGSIRHGDALRPDIAEMTRRRGVDPSTLPNFEHVAGVGWDVEQGAFKLYALLNNLADLQDPEMRALVAAVDEPSYETGMFSYSIVNGRVVEKKVYVGLKERVGKRITLPAVADSVIHTNYMVTTDRGIVPQMDVLKPFDASRLGPESAEIARVYMRELGASLDTFSYDLATYSLTLYFS